MKNCVVLISLMLAATLLAACGGAPGAAATPAATLPPVKDSSGISSEGKLTPLQWAELSFGIGGEVAEILVKEGDPVKAGNVIARLNADAQQVAVIRAEAGVAAAEASEAKYQEQLPQQIASAQADLQAAQAQIVSASAQRDTHAAIAAAEAAWRQARLDQQQAEDAHQKVIDAELFGPREEQARLVVENAERATQAAWLRLEQMKSGSASDRANSAELAAARSRLGAAQAKLDRLKAEANGQPNQTYVAAIQQAEAALQSARVRLADTELRAPFDGTLAQLNLKVGETATPGSPVVVLADFSGWQVVTEDLTEIEVPGVQESQPVQITIDALPELKLKGEVKSIGSVYQTQSGDIVYPVKISLLDTDARLRWGMTAGVAFEK